MVVWIIVAFAVISMMLVIAMVGGYVERLRRDPSLDARARTALHGARRRLDTSQMRLAFKADSTRARRELDHELRNIDREDEV